MHDEWALHHAVAALSHEPKMKAIYMHTCGWQLNRVAVELRRPFASKQKLCDPVQSSSLCWGPSLNSSRPSPLINYQFLGNPRPIISHEQLWIPWIPKLMHWIHVKRTWEFLHDLGRVFQRSTQQIAPTFSSYHLPSHLPPNIPPFRQSCHYFAVCIFLQYRTQQRER